MTQEIFLAAAQEHGHQCPGLALGLRASEIAQAVMKWEGKPEGLTCSVDRRACYVDGVRFMTGCTPENGTITFRNDGQWAFVFSKDGVSVRVELAARPDFTKGREAMTEQVLYGPAEEVFRVTEYQEISD